MQLSSCLWSPQHQLMLLLLFLSSITLSQSFTNQLYLAPPALKHPRFPQTPSSIPSGQLCGDSSLSPVGRQTRQGLELRMSKMKTSQAAKSVEDLQALILSRRTINDFEPTLPEGWEESVEKAVKAAIYAPNHKRSEPWRFHLLGPDSIQKVCELNAEIVTEKKGDKAGQKKLERWLLMPGWMVITQKVGDEEPKAFLEPASQLKEDYAAVCCAVHNFCLSLHARGMGTKWTTGPVNFDPRFREATGVPEDEDVVGTIWFGTPTKVPEPPKKKLKVSDVLIRHD